MNFERITIKYIRDNPKQVTGQLKSHLLTTLEIEFTTHKDLIIITFS